MDSLSAPTSHPKRYTIHTFGCQMNEADTERMSALLEEDGLERAAGLEDADVILVNGCSVRDKAVHKALSFLGRLRPLMGEGTVRRPIIGLGGCVGQIDQGEIFSSQPFVDFVFGPDAIEQIPDIVRRAWGGQSRQVHTKFDASKTYSTRTRILKPQAQAFVNIMKGCDKFCTYCIVPFTRGREKSRTIEEVLTDVADLVAHGVREITLLGQNVNSFGKGNPNTRGLEPKELSSPIGRVGPDVGEENFPQLLRALDSDPRCKELKWIRFTSSHPLDFSDELLDCYAPVAQGGVSRLAAHLHLPVQSGSNRVLQKMGRHHKIETYIQQMERLRAMRPDVAVSTDLIVGFPTETEEDFAATLALMDRIEFDNLFAFAYSPRPGTRAEKLPDDVPDAEKNRRLVSLLAHQQEISTRRYRSRIGARMEVRVEGKAKKQQAAEWIGLQGDLVWAGRSTCNRLIHFVSRSPRDLAGRFVDVEIRNATPLALYGEMTP